VSLETEGANGKGKRISSDETVRVLKLPPMVKQMLMARKQKLSIQAAEQRMLSRSFCCLLTSALES